MGYDHYLWRPPELDLQRWQEWVGDVRQIISNLPPSAAKTYYYPLEAPPVTVRAPLIVTGPIGNEGRPELTDSSVAFNGGGWVDVDGQPQRLWGASFWVDRVYAPPAFDPLPNDPLGDLEARPAARGWCCESFRTNHRPYDLAVTASLIRLAHRFPEGVQVSSDGGPEDWQPGLDLCRQVFGHAELPFAIGDVREPAGPARLNELLLKRDEGLLAPHEVGELRDLLERDLEAEQSLGSVDVPGLQPDQPECAP